jgi:hypothetical protein
LEYLNLICYQKINNILKKNLNYYTYEKLCVDFDFLEEKKVYNLLLYNVVKYFKMYQDKNLYLHNLQYFYFKIDV